MRRKSKGDTETATRGSSFSLFRRGSRKPASQPSSPKGVEEEAGGDAAAPPSPAPEQTAEIPAPAAEVGASEADAAVTNAQRLKALKDSFGPDDELVMVEVKRGSTGLGVGLGEFLLPGYGRLRHVV